jgi:uncharacterized protein (DUF488 family)
VTIYTIGHSTRRLETFLDLLRVHGIRRLADIRTVPRSRRHPHFSRESLERSLPVAGVAYRHFPGLGGLRRPRRDSQNLAWRHDGFRGYADHMMTDEFEEAVDALLAYATEPTTVMCAEAVWWQCHRRLLSDALFVRGIDVRHIVSDAPAAPHTLTEFARPRGGKVSYPGLLSLSDDSGNQTGPESV